MALNQQGRGGLVAPQLLVNSSTHAEIAYGQVIGPNSSHEAGQDATLVYAASPATVKGAHRDFITRSIHFITSADELEIA